MEEHLNWPEEDIIDIAVEDWNPQEHTDDIHNANNTPETDSDLIQVNQAAVDTIENHLVHDPLEECFDTMEEEFGDIFEDAMEEEVDHCDIVFQDAQEAHDTTRDESPEAAECKENHDDDGLHCFDAEDLCLESPGKAFHLNVDAFRKAGKE